MFLSKKRLTWSLFEGRPFCLNGSRSWNFNQNCSSIKLLHKIGWISLKPIVLSQNLQLKFNQETNHIEISKFVKWSSKWKQDPRSSRPTGAFALYILYCSVIRRRNLTLFRLPTTSTQKNTAHRKTVVPQALVCWGKLGISDIKALVFMQPIVSIKNQSAIFLVHFLNRTFNTIA